MEIHNRIQKIIQSVSQSAAQFADEIGIQRSSVSHLISGRNKPSTDFLQKLLISFPQINVEWLLTGKGDMYRNSIQESNKNLFSDLTTNTKQKPTITNFSKPIEKETESAYKAEHKDITNPQEGITPPKNAKKEIERIVIFYSDKSFEEYTP